MENQQPISVGRFEVPEPTPSENLEQLRQQLMQVASTPEGQESLKRLADQISNDPYNWANQYNQTGA